MSDRWDGSRSFDWAAMGDCRACESYGRRERGDDHGEKGIEPDRNQYIIHPVQNRREMLFLLPGVFQGANPG